MTELGHGIGKTRANVVAFEIREVAQDLIFADAVRQHFENVDDADAHAANARTPMALIAVSPMMTRIASGTISRCPPNAGEMNDRADTAPTATDACAVQFETQNDQATRKPMVGPNSRSIFAWMPSPPSRDRRAIAETTHSTPTPGNHSPC